MTTAIDSWLTASEASAILDRSHPQVTRICRLKWQPEGRAKKLGRDWRVDPEAVEEHKARLRPARLIRTNKKAQPSRRSFRVYEDLLSGVDLAGLPPRDREIVELYLSDLSGTAIAARLGVSEATVRRAVRESAHSLANSS